MTSISNLNSTDELEYGKWISLKNVQTVPLSIDKFWSAFDDYLTFLKSFSGRDNVELETGFGKPKNSPGAIVQFDFENSLVRDRLLINDRQNHVWKMDIPEATRLFTLYLVTITAHEIGDCTEVSIIVDFVLQNQNKEERGKALKTLKEYLPKRIPEIVKFIQQRDGVEFLPLTELEVRQLATDFYLKLDTHAPVKDYTPFFTFEEGFKMHFPNTTVQSWEEFNQWYENSINLYFDEVHELKGVSITASSDCVDVKAIVHWEGTLWKPPGAHSERIIADAHHTWVVKRSPQTHKAMFKSYIVHQLDFAQGSAKLEAPAIDSRV